MRLHQYWHELPPPDDVAGWIEGFRSANPDFDHRLYDETAAAAFISAHYGPAELAAFEACGLAAMQADFFRLCLMDAVGGLYLDADQQPLAPLAGLVAQAPHALMPTWHGIAGTGVLMFRRAGHPLMRACLRLARDNLLERRFASVLMASGPGVVHAARVVADPALPAEAAALAGLAWADQGWDELLALARRTVEASPDLAEACSRMTLLPTEAVQAWVGVQPADYKSTDAYWYNWTGDIYRAAAKTTA